MGSESHGLPPELAGLADMMLGIPYHDPESHAESLNVGVASAIFCAEFRRRGL
jgi:TrmH family RNA methyltransferase